jgi:hypothetical protein
MLDRKLAAVHDNLCFPDNNWAYYSATTKPATPLIEIRNATGSAKYIEAPTHGQRESSDWDHDCIDGSADVTAKERV